MKKRKEKKRAETRSMGKKEKRQRTKRVRKKCRSKRPDHKKKINELTVQEEPSM